MRFPPCYLIVCLILNFFVLRSQDDSETKDIINFFQNLDFCLAHNVTQPDEPSSENCTNTLEHHSEIDKHLFDHLLRNAPEEILFLISILQNQGLKKDWPQSILFEGEPGVGKSTYAKIVALATGRPYFFIKTATLANEYQHSGAQSIERIFTNAIAQARIQPIVLIFDEINSIVDDSNIETHKRLIDKSTCEAFWMWLDECSKNKNILIIGTTNDATTLKEQVLSRFDGDIMRVRVPEGVSFRRDTISYYLSLRKNNCTDECILALAKKTKTFTPRALEKIVIKAHQIAAFRCGNNVVIDNEDLLKALAQIQKSRIFAIKSRWKSLKEEFLKSGVPTISAMAALCTTASCIIGFYFLAKGNTHVRF